VIAGETFSGPVQVDFKLGRRRDVKSAPGVNGATVTDTGERPCDVTIRLEMWLEEHWAFYTRVLVPLVQPKLQAPPSSGAAGDANGIPQNFFVKTTFGNAYSYTAALEQELLVNQPAQAAAEGLGLLVTNASTAASSRSEAARKRALAPVSVYHPALAGADIRQLHMEELTSPRKVRPGLYEVTLKGTRFTAKRSAAVTTSTAGATDSGLGSIRLASELTGRPPPSSTDNKP
jgi:hypothetical protein